MIFSESLEKSKQKIKEALSKFSSTTPQTPDQGFSSPKRAQSPGQSSHDPCDQSNSSSSPDSSPKRARSPKRKQNRQNRSRSSSTDRRSSSEDKDFQEFSRIVTEKPRDDENRKSEFLFD